MKFTKETHKALRKASKESKRDGKWATIPEVRDESEGIPMEVKLRPILVQLVKENRAEKKKNQELWRPTGVGAGGGGSGAGGMEGYRSPDPYDNLGRNTPVDKRDVRPIDESPRDAGSDTSGSTVKAAIGAMIGGTAVGGGNTGAPSGVSYR